MQRNKIISYAQIIARLLLAGMLIFAGILKVQDNSALFETVAYITWLPLGLKSLTIDLLPWVEIMVGFFLLTFMFDKITLPVNALIYLTFFIFAIYGFSTGIEGDCGCFGDLDDDSLAGMLLGSSFGWTMTIRNAIFVAMAGFLFWTPNKPR